MMKNAISLIFLFIGFCAFSQQRSVEVHWESTLKQPKNVHLANGNYQVFEQWEAQGAPVTPIISNAKWAAVPDSLAAPLKGELIPADIEVSMTKAQARNKAYHVLEVSAMRKVNGRLQRLMSFDLRYQTEQRSRQNLRQNINVQNSVLATGDWFRFYTPKAGVYKLTANYLRRLGVDIGSLDPRTLKIYSYGGEMLPLKNADNQDYDLPQVAIQVVGEADGSFDANDYILFYSNGIHELWSEENKTTQHLYADKSYYYLSYGGVPGLRVGGITQPNGNAQHSFNNFDAEQVYEKDDYNLSLTGRRWFGDRFDVQSNREYSFTFSNLDTAEPVRVLGAAAASSESPTSMQVAVNTQNITNLSFGVTGKYVYGSQRSFDEELSVNSEEVKVSFTYNNAGNPASVGYLDYIRVQAKRKLQFEGNQMPFTQKQAALLTGIGEYQFSQASNIAQIWDVTNPSTIMAYTHDGAAQLTLKANMGEQRKYIAFSNQGFLTPLNERNARVPNQNLKASLFQGDGGVAQDLDYLIVTSSEFQSEANRLAAYREDRDGLHTKVVLLEEIYHEFSSGKPDIVAIRNLVKYAYENAPNPQRKLKYLTLFGDASVDYKNRLPNNNNIVPTYQDLPLFSSIGELVASDDFYGMMDDDEGEMGIADKLDLAVGRLLVDDLSLARSTVDKIIAYESKESFGSWRNNFLLISDDANQGDFDLQVTLDEVGDDIAANKPFINVKKIHADAFEQQSSSGGFRYPAVNKAIAEAIDVGVTVVNYLGHGGENGLAAERIVTKDDILSWQNENRYNVMVTVTCIFTRFDNPLRVSPGELNLHQSKSGSVAMVATTRDISVSTGKNFNTQFAPYLFNYNNTDDSVAEAVRKAKNDNGSFDRRVIFYFGDAAMKLQLPKPQVRLTHLNDVPIAQSQDTLKALSKIKIAGEVVNASGQRLSNYTGELSSIVFDKKQQRKTLGNDGTVIGGQLAIMEFETLGEIIFRGNASVREGLFSFEFVVPKDIAIPVGEGRVSFYAEENDALVDQKGYNNSILVGGINQNAPEDNIGPEIQLFMNDDSFISGGITNDSPFLLVHLQDENGINTASGIGHDLVAILDGDETNPLVVNDFYETEVDDYTRGKVRYKLRDLEEGLHTLKFIAWDVYNNSSEAEIQFVVTGSDELKITRVLNYPNPFSSYTEFWFNHNRPYEPLEVQVQVFTVTGKIVWSTRQVVNTTGFLSREIIWNGRDDFGDRIGKGVYVYKLTVKSTLTNKRAEKYEKLVIL